MFRSFYFGIGFKKPLVWFHRRPQQGNVAVRFSSLFTAVAWDQIWLGTPSDTRLKVRL